MSMRRLAQAYLEDKAVTPSLKDGDFKNFIRDYLEYFFIPSSSLRFARIVDKQGKSTSTFKKGIFYVEGLALEIAKVRLYYEGIVGLF